MCLLVQPLERGARPRCEAPAEACHSAFSTGRGIKESLQLTSALRVLRFLGDQATLVAARRGGRRAAACRAGGAATS